MENEEMKLLIVLSVGLMAIIFIWAEVSLKSCDYDCMPHYEQQTAFCAYD
jgi:hypothetical protein